MVDACLAQFISNSQPAKDADSLLNQRLMVWDVSPYSTLCVCECVCWQGEGGCEGGTASHVNTGILSAGNQVPPMTYKD